MFFSVTLCRICHKYISTQVLLIKNVVFINHDSSNKCTARKYLRFVFIRMKDSAKVFCIIFSLGILMLIISIGAWSVLYYTSNELKSGFVDSSHQTFTLRTTIQHYIGRHNTTTAQTTTSQIVQLPEDYWDCTIRSSKCLKLEMEYVTIF